MLKKRKRDESGSSAEHIYEPQQPFLAASYTKQISCSQQQHQPLQLEDMYEATQTIAGL